MIRNAEVCAGATMPRERRSRARFPVEVVGLLYFLLLVGGGMLLVWQPARVAQVNDRVQNLEHTLHELRLRNEDLKKTVAQVEALSYVERAARERLGMVDPSEIRTVSLPEATVNSQEVAVASGKDSQQGGIFSLYRRIAQIFKSGEATAKERRLP